MQEVPQGSVGSFRVCTQCSLRTDALAQQLRALTLAWHRVNPVRALTLAWRWLNRADAAAVMPPPPGSSPTTGLASAAAAVGSPGPHRKPATLDLRNPPRVQGSGPTREPAGIAYTPKVPGSRFGADLPSLHRVPRRPLPVFVARRWSSSSTTGSSAATDPSRCAWAPLLLSRSTPAESRAIRASRWRRRWDQRRAQHAGRSVRSAAGGGGALSAG